MNPRSASRPARPWIAIVVALAAALPACSRDSRFGAQPAPLDAVDRNACDDEDGDSYGPGCALGEDCDDTSADVTDECYRCAVPSAGCACDVEGAYGVCPKATIQVGEQKMCGPGYAVCHDGAWGECVINFTAVTGS